MLRHALVVPEALTYGVSYAFLQNIIRSPTPLDPEWTWHNITKDMPPGTNWVRAHWPLKPLRRALLAYDGPALIYHGRHDVLVPYEAAVEHHRLLPPSGLVTSDGDHFDTFMRPVQVADALGPVLAAGGPGEAADAIPAAGRYLDGLGVRAGAGAALRR